MRSEGFEGKLHINSFVDGLYMRVWIYGDRDRILQMLSELALLSEITSWAWLYQTLRESEIQNHSVLLGFGSCTQCWA